MFPKNVLYPFVFHKIRRHRINLFNHKLESKKEKPSCDQQKGKKIYKLLLLNQCNLWSLKWGFKKCLLNKNDDENNRVDIQSQAKIRFMIPSSYWLTQFLLCIQSILIIVLMSEDLNVEIKESKRDEIRSNLSWVIELRLILNKVPHVSNFYWDF